MKKTGKGSRSLVHSQDFSERLEAGTINVMGIFGLAAALRYLERRDIENIYAHEMTLTKQLIDGISSVTRIRLYCTDSLKHHLPLFSCNIEGMNAEQVSAILDGDYGIATRAGVHCSPLTHVSLGTAPGGAVRFSFWRFQYHGRDQYRDRSYEEYLRKKVLFFS